MYKTLRFWVCEQLASLASLVGGWTTHLKNMEKYARPIVIISPKGFRGENSKKKYWETTSMEIQCLAT